MLCLRNIYKDFLNGFAKFQLALFKFPQGIFIHTGSNKDKTDAVNQRAEKSVGSSLIAENCVAHFFDVFLSGFRYARLVIIICIRPDSIKDLRTIRFQRLCFNSHN